MVVMMIIMMMMVAAATGGLGTAQLRTALYVFAVFRVREEGTLTAGTSDLRGFGDNVKGLWPAKRLLDPSRSCSSSRAMRFYRYTRLDLSNVIEASECAVVHVIAEESDSGRLRVQMYADAQGRFEVEDTAATRYGVVLDALDVAVEEHHQCVFPRFPTRRAAPHLSHAAHDYRCAEHCRERRGHVQPHRRRRQVQGGHGRGRPARPALRLRSSDPARPAARATRTSRASRASGGPAKAPGPAVEVDAARTCTPEVPRAGLGAELATADARLAVARLSRLSRPAAASSRTSSSSARGAEV
ncbi:hypothetical protein GGR56DRAFT_70927 [Xylariaceae sp. FL0804]|nr:hypothetical protein GGR56DRAFT_70927 [Xylariaceae sp. FL0804]